MPPARATQQCPACGLKTAPGNYCTHCGALLHPVDAERGTHYAAAPQQHLLAPAVVATLFPHLPLRGHHSYRIALAAGAATIAVLALVGLFPVALIAAAVLVPLLVVLYFHDVDLYEEEPLRVIVLTLVWGALAGVAVGFLRDAVLSSAAVLEPQTQSGAVLWNGVGLPLIGLLAALVGPLVLLRYRNFNDTLDGATFGSAAAVAFAGAYLLTESTTFLAGGLAPAGLVEPWLLRVLTLGIALPVLAAAAGGGAAASFWLRYRAPRRERRLHRLFAQPALGLAAAGVLLAGAALLQIYLDRWAALAAIVALDVVALVWLRCVIHVGLVEEHAEVTEQPPGRCANCGRSLPRGAFCSYCGVAVRALPKAGREHGPAERRRLLASFATALAVLVGIAVVAMAAAEPAGYKPPCASATQGCANPPQLTGVGSPFTKQQLTVWTSAAGTHLTYPPKSWSVVSRSRDQLQLLYSNELDLSVQTALSGTPQQVLSSAVNSLRGRYPDLELDPSHTLASASIGPVLGIGGLYAGHDALNGSPVEALIEVASQDGLTVAVRAWTSQQAQPSRDGLATPFAVLANANSVLESFQWPVVKRHKLS
jgi:hypothetical protein